MFIRILHIAFVLIFGTCSIFVAHAKADTQNRYASIIIDYETLEVLHARKIDGSRFPASLTKMMTLYLTFDALNRGDISLNERMSVSNRAARTPPVKLGLQAGQSITVEQAIQALAVRSANDVAVVLAERLGGSESEFADLMTRKAKALGMRSTVFQNPHGLPNPSQFSTARDMAKLAEALLRNHPQYYPYFSQRKFTYNGHTYNNHNALLGTVDGVDGFKTGFTNASGYNLVLSAKRDGKRIIAVVMGGASGKSRDKHMADLIERGFTVLEQNKLRSTQTKFAKLVPETPLAPVQVKHQAVPDRIQAFTLRAASGSSQETVRIVHGGDHMQLPAAVAKDQWAVQIGVFQTEFHAGQANHYLQSDAALNLQAAKSQIVPVQKNNTNLFRARVGGISHQQADKACKTLASRGQYCLVIAPS
jgi:D-alanyl-D-alanine carboxypeptidase